MRVLKNVKLVNKEYVMVTEGSILNIPQDDPTSKVGDYWCGAIGYVFASGTIQLMADGSLGVKVTKIKVLEEKNVSKGGL